MPKKNKKLNKLYPIFSILFISGCSNKIESNKKTNYAQKYTNSNYGSASCNSLDIDLKEVLESEIFSTDKYKIFKEKFIKMYHESDINSFLLETHEDIYSFDKTYEYDSIIDFYTLLKNINLENERSNELIFNKLRILEAAIEKKLNILKNIGENLSTSIDHMNDEPLKMYFRQEDLKFEAIEKVENLYEIIKKIKIENNIPNDHIPNLNSKNLLGEKTIEFINPINHELKSYPVLSADFTQFKNSKDYLNQFISNDDKLNTIGEGYSGLNKAFAIQALFEHFSRNNNVYENTERTAFGKILKYHSYIYNTQMAMGVIDEMKYVNDIVNGVNAAKQMETSSFSETSSGLYGKTSAGLGLVLQGISVGLDIAELVNAKTYYEKSTSITRLTFDSGGLALGTAGFFGATALGYLAAPVAGIGIGVTAIVGNFAKHTQDAINIANTLNRYKSTFENYLLPIHENKFFKELYNEKEPHINFSIIDNNYNLDPISEIDLRLPGIIKMKRKDSYISKTENPANDTDDIYKIHHNFGKNSYPIVKPYEIKLNNLDKNNFINLRKALAYHLPHDIKYRIQDTTNNSTHAFPPIILPIFPETYYSYNYKTISYYSDAFNMRPEISFDAVRKLHFRNDFTFSYFYYVLGMFPDAKSIDELIPRYNNSDITIKLGATSAQLITPKIPNELHHKVNYNFEGSEEGHYNVMAQLGASYHFSGTGEETFLIDVSSFSLNPDHSINAQIIGDLVLVMINDVKFTFHKINKPKNIFFRHKDKQISEIDVENFIYKTPNLKMSALNNFDFNTLKEFKKHTNSEYIEITDFPLQIMMLKSNNADIEYEAKNIEINKNYKAWFDVKSNELIYPNYKYYLNEVASINSHSEKRDPLKLSLLGASNRNEVASINSHSEKRDPLKLSLLGTSNRKYYYYSEETKSVYFNTIQGEKLSKILINQVERSYLVNNELIFEVKDSKKNNSFYNTLFFSTLNHKIHAIIMNSKNDKINDAQNLEDTLVTASKFNNLIEFNMENIVNLEVFEKFTRILNYNGEFKKNKIWYNFQNSKIISANIENKEDKDINILDTFDGNKYLFYKPNTNEIISQTNNAGIREILPILKKIKNVNIIDKKLFVVDENNRNFEYNHDHDKFYLLKLDIDDLDVTKIEDNLNKLKIENPNVVINEFFYLQSHDNNGIYFTNNKKIAESVITFDPELDKYKTNYQFNF